MKLALALSPQRSDDLLTVAVVGDVLTINGEAVDLATYEMGDNSWIVGQPEHAADEWRVELVLPYGQLINPDDPAARAVLFPAPIRVTQDGPVLLPTVPLPAFDIGGDGT